MRLGVDLVDQRMEVQIRSVELAVKRMKMYEAEERNEDADEREVQLKKGTGGILSKTRRFVDRRLLHQ